MLNDTSPPAATAQPVSGASARRPASRSTTSCTLIPSVPPPPSGRVFSIAGGPAGPEESNGGSGPVASTVGGTCTSWMNPSAASYPRPRENTFRIGRPPSSLRTKLSLSAESITRAQWSSRRRIRAPEALSVSTAAISPISSRVPVARGRA